MSKPAYFVGPWDLHRDLACVPRHPSDGTVVFVESQAKGRALPYHRQKLVLVLSAMHHFAAELREAGFDVTIENAPTYLDGIARHVRTRGSSEVIALAPREHGIWRRLQDAARGGALGVPLRLHDDGGAGGHFLLTRAEFLGWARGRKQLRMDQFYAQQRKDSGYLMIDGKPVGGRFSFDDENRGHARGQRPPTLPRHEPDALTRDIMARVARWPGGFGAVDGFDWPVTRAQALAELEHFIDVRAPLFGTYEDAMLSGQRFLWHARLSPPLNLSLLHPREVIERVLAAHAAGRVPLNAAEGFLRQILGWREFIRGVYWLRMPEMRTANLLEARRPLPLFYWEPERTEMRCLRESAAAVRDTGYTHHIQRLMVLGNFALLAGINPIDVSHWFWAGFVDAYEWVELPNVHGMALFADPGFTTKPYAASGAYIDRMSDYCKGCRYDVKRRSGADACPFNPLYWTFLLRHRERLAQNPRMATLLKTWDRFSAEEQAAIRASAQAVLDGLAPTPEGAYVFRDDDG